MRRRTTSEFRGIRQEVATIARQAAEVWRLIPGRHKMSLAGALGIMSLASGANTEIALCVGKLIDSVNPDEHTSQSAADLTRVAAFYLAIIGGAYLVREVMNVLRRLLVEDTCTRIDRDMYVRVVSHLLKVDLGVLAHDQVGCCTAVSHVVWTDWFGSCGSGFSISSLPCSWGPLPCRRLWRSNRGLRWRWPE